MGDHAFHVEFEGEDRPNRECRHDHYREVAQSSIWTTEVQEDQGKSSRRSRQEFEKIEARVRKFVVSKCCQDVILKGFRVEDCGTEYNVIFNDSL